MSRRTVFGPDGREWQITRRVEEGPLTNRLLGRSRWVIEAVTTGEPAESRHWYADRRSQADEVVREVAMALRTGAEGPPQPEN